MARKSTTTRGYGYLHQKMRERIAPQVEAGLLPCARCGLPILFGQAWELDHAPGKQGYLGPSHRKCNRRAGGKEGAAITNGQRLRHSRVW
jgi:hypothetical protein